MGIESLNSNMGFGVPSYGTGSEAKVNVEPVKVSTPDIKDPELLAAKVASESKSEESKEQKEKLDAAVEKLNETANIFNHSLRFRVHEATHRTMISVIDKNTDKVIREIPGEEALDLVADLQKNIGLIFDKKA